MKQKRVIRGTATAILALFLAVGCAYTADLKQASKEQVKLLDQLIQTAGQLRNSFVEYLKGERDLYISDRNAFLIPKLKEKGESLFEIELQREIRGVPSDAEKQEKAVRNVLTKYINDLGKIDRGLAPIPWDYDKLKNNQPSTNVSCPIPAPFVPGPSLYKRAIEVVEHEVVTKRGPTRVKKLKLSQEFKDYDESIQKHYLYLSCTIEEQVEALRRNLQKLKEGHAIIDRYLQIEIKIPKDTSKEIENLLKELSKLREELRASKTAASGS